MPVELPVGYHLCNFLSLIRFVRSQYHDLLNSEELAYADDFEQLSSQAQSLYVRMVLRKGSVFRSDKLNYVDVEDTAGAAAELAAAGFIDDQYDAEEILGLLTKPELLAWVPDCAGAKKLLRDELLDLIQTEVDVLAMALPFAIYHPLGDEILLLYRLLFFGNLAQDFSEFVLTDMGMLRYEPYTIPESVRLFDSREEIDQSWSMYQLRELCDGLIEIEEFAKLPALAELCPDPGLISQGASSLLVRRRDRLLNHIARHLERQEFTVEALALYAQSQSPPGRERRARILKKSGEEEAALAICHEIFADPADEEELEFASRFAQPLIKRLTGKSNISQTLLAYETQLLQLAQPENRGVEEAVRRYFEAEAGQCFYVENGLIPGLFGLCFWDIIFHPLKGSFVNLYQRGPLDLFTPSFRPARLDAIETRFTELQKPGVLQTQVHSSYADKAGIANHFVNWGLLSEDLLELSLARIPLPDLLSMFRRLLFDLRNNRSGFPDLIYFPDQHNWSGSDKKGYQMIEVKGPGDQLQLNQKRWIKAFMAHNIPFKLARVQWLQETENSAKSL